MLYLVIYHYFLPSRFIPFIYFHLVTSINHSVYFVYFIQPFQKNHSFVCNYNYFILLIIQRLHCWCDTIIKIYITRLVSNDISYIIFLNNLNNRHVSAIINSQSTSVISPCSCRATCVTTEVRRKSMVTPCTPPYHRDMLLTDSRVC